LPGKLAGKIRLGHVVVEGGIILKWILNKLDGKTSNGFIRLKTRTRGGFL
jgi:hypothetical protein